MFFYFEPNFIEKFYWESGFSNFGYMTISNEFLSIAKVTSVA